MQEYKKILKISAKNVFLDKGNIKLKKMNTPKASQKIQIANAQIEKISKKHTLCTSIARRFLRTVTMISAVCSLSFCTIYAVESGTDTLDNDSRVKRTFSITETKTTLIQKVHVLHHNNKIVLEVQFSDLLFSNKDYYAVNVDGNLFVKKGIAPTNQRLFAFFPNIPHVPGRAEWLAVCPNKRDLFNLVGQNNHTQHDNRIIECPFSQIPADQSINVSVAITGLHGQQSLCLTPSVRPETEMFGILGGLLMRVGAKAGWNVNTATHAGEPVTIPITKPSDVHNISKTAPYQPPQKQKDVQTKKPGYKPDPAYLTQGPQPQSEIFDQHGNQHGNSDALIDYDNNGKRDTVLRKIDKINEKIINITKDSTDNQKKMKLIELERKKQILEKELRILFK